MPHASHLTQSELEAGLEEIRRSPRDAGTLQLIVRRSQSEQREVLQRAELDLAEGLVGDCWSAGPRPASRDTQLTLINARAIALIAVRPERWPLAGDQLYVDLDLSAANLPPGTRLSIGAAVVEITAEPHTGCGKFRERFGSAALQFVNSPVGRALNLRGVNAQVVTAGAIRHGDCVRKL